MITDNNGKRTSANKRAKEIMTGFVNINRSKNYFDKNKKYFHIDLKWWQDGLSDHEIQRITKEIEKIRFKELLKKLKK